MAKTDDDKAYEAGVKKGLERSWLFDMVYDVVGTVIPGRHAEIFQKGYEWGRDHRHDSPEAGKKGEKESS